MKAIIYILLTWVVVINIGIVLFRANASIFWIPFVCFGVLLTAGIVKYYRK